MAAPVEHPVREKALREYPDAPKRDSGNDRKEADRSGPFDRAHDHHFDRRFLELECGLVPGDRGTVLNLL